MGYLIPANSKKSMLIFGAFTGFDLGLLAIGGSISLVLLLLVPLENIWMALGATIDFEAGNIQRAPKIYQKFAMEWFCRFLKEPKRMFKRYFIDDMKFFWFFGKQLLGIYKDPFS